MSRSGVFGNKTLEWKVAYHGTDKRLMKLTNFSKGDGMIN
jgi:hypothetical protein